jgi:predicted dinucleotide-binding enzyme
MNIVIIGRGNVGGGLARFWSDAGHITTALGRDGGDASEADVVVIAVPGDTIEAALATVSGASGKVTIDATNAFGPRDGAFPSLAHQVKSIIDGPVAKSFNTNYAALYDEIGKQRVRPSNLFAAEPDARPFTEQLIRDAGYDPVFLGGLEAARLVEDYLLIGMAVGNQMGPYFYRMATPGEL